MEPGQGGGSWSTSPLVGRVLSPSELCTPLLCAAAQRRALSPVCIPAYLSTWQPGVPSKAEQGADTCPLSTELAGGPLRYTGERAFERHECFREDEALIFNL